MEGDTYVAIFKGEKIVTETNTRIHEVINHKKV